MNLSFITSSPDLDLHCFQKRIRVKKRGLSFPSNLNASICLRLIAEGIWLCDHPGMLPPTL